MSLKILSKKRMIQDDGDTYVHDKAKKSLTF